jgi:ribosomal protein S1
LLILSPLSLHDKKVPEVVVEEIDVGELVGVIVLGVVVNVDDDVVVVVIGLQHSGNCCVQYSG